MAEAWNLEAHALGIVAVLPLTWTVTEYFTKSWKMSALELDKASGSHIIGIWWFLHN